MLRGGVMGIPTAPRRTAYVTHHRYRGPALDAKPLNLPYGTALFLSGEVLFTQDGRPVCCRSSEAAKRHFARDDDGAGLARGALTYAIAYAKRGEGRRFSDAEAARLERDWPQFLRQGQEMLLFNDAFFAASPEELQAVAKALNIRGILPL